MENENGINQTESLSEQLWQLLEPIQTLGLILTGFPLNLHQLRRQAESLAIRQEKIDSGLVTDENEIKEFEEKKAEFWQRARETFLREAFDRESFS